MTHAAPIAAFLTLLPIVFRADQTDAASIALAERFDATVMFVGDGCGTLIDERWILTAAHVARGLSPFSPRIRVGEKEYRVRRSFYHPESASDGQRPPRVDLALVELAEEVKGVKPVRMYERDDETGQDVFVVGYGDFGPAGKRLTYTDGKRRAATNTVDRAQRGRLVIDFDAPPDGTSLEGVGAPGDSGGSLYIESEKGLFLAGVSSASMGGPPESYGVIDLYTRVSEFTDWIEKTRKAAADTPGGGPEIRELAQGFPKEARGELIAAFFACFGDDEAMATFGTKHRSKDALRRNPGGAFAARMSRLAEELGALTPKRVALIGPERWVVLTETAKDGWRAVHFRFAVEESVVRLMDLGMRRESAPAEK
ncbi:MAG: trypsin-like serine protease [bacterium]|nr:trypsin-like serine protease [bacterium]